MSSSGQRPIVIGSFAETTDTLANLCSLCPLIFASNGYISTVFAIGDRDIDPWPRAITRTEIPIARKIVLFFNDLSNSEVG